MCFSSNKASNLLLNESGTHVYESLIHLLFFIYFYCLMFKISFLIANIVSIVTKGKGKEVYFQLYD